MNEQHTPAPWHAMPKLAPAFDDHGFRLVASCRKDIQIYAEAQNMLQEGKGFVWGSAEADAALISAAPELLALLEKALRYIEVETAYKSAMTAAEVEAAIVGQFAPSRVDICANSCCELASFSFVDTRAAIAKTKGQA